MTKKIICIAILGLIAGSCKKTWTCECKNSNGTYDAGQTENTKRKAKKYCEELSEGQTSCYLKE